MEVVHLSSVKYSVGGLSFMDGRGFEKGEEMVHERDHGKVADPVICL
jgi:hypothetical protein